MSLTVKRVGSKLAIAGTTDPAADSGIIILQSASGRTVAFPVDVAFGFEVELADGYYTARLDSWLLGIRISTETIPDFRISERAYSRLAQRQLAYLLGHGNDYLYSQALLDEAEICLSNNNPLGFETYLYAQDSTYADRDWHRN